MTLEARCSPPGGCATGVTSTEERTRPSLAPAPRPCWAWLQNSVLLPLNMNCMYNPVLDQDLRFHPSNHVLVYLVSKVEQIPDTC